MEWEQLTEVVSFRVTEAERARLAALASETGRRPSDLMRRLLNLAELTGQPDLCLVGDLPPAREGG